MSQECADDKIAREFLFANKFSFNVCTYTVSDYLYQHILINAIIYCLPNHVSNSRISLTTGIVQYPFNNIDL